MATGVPYDAIVWQDVQGQPFGVGAGYNGLILGNLTNIVDIEGAVAVQGDAQSYRGMSVGFGGRGQQTLPLSATDVRFLAGGSVDIAGALTVVGNVVASGGFQAGNGSTYLIGKDGSENQRATLAALYEADGSPYWAPADNGDDYIISSYDVPRFIPASRVDADISGFFEAARQSLLSWQARIGAMDANGEVREGEYGYVLTGTQTQNVYDIDWPESGSVEGNLTLEAPAGSVNLVRVHGGESMTITTPVWGKNTLTQTTLFVLMDAREVSLDFPSVIHGSVLAPQAAWSANTTGGGINGNAALRSLTVAQGSGFELHWHPFAGGVRTGEESAEGTEPQEIAESPEGIAGTEAASCPPCTVTPGVISGCMIPCGQCAWRLCLMDAVTHRVLYAWQHCGMDCFSFEADATGDYALGVETRCRYELCLKNVGVKSLSVHG